jgi:tetratricopeptide (TPR) repeat protein
VPMDVNSHIAKADEALRKKNFDYAVSLLEQVLSLQPDHGAARRKWVEALRAKAGRKSTPGWLSKLGGSPHMLSAAMSGLAKSAGGKARALEKYLTQDPLNADAHLNLGEALLAAGFADSAAAVFEALGEAEPKLGVAWKRAAASHAQRQRLEEALACLEKALKADPKDAESERMRKNLSADLTLRKGAYERAGSSRELVRDVETQERLERESRIHKTGEDLAHEEKELTEKLQANAKDGRARRRLAEILAKGSRWAEAHKLLEGGIPFDENAGELRDRIGDLKLKELDFEIGKLEKRLATESNPNLKDDLDLLKADRAKLELADFRRRAAEKPTDLALQYQLGRALADAGEIDEALGAFQKSVKDPKTRVDSLLKLGACFQKKGLPDLAEKQLKTALEESSAASERGKSILYNLGLIAEQAGRKSDAFNWFSRIYEVDIAYRDVARKIESLRS